MSPRPMPRRTIVVALAAVATGAVLAAAPAQAAGYSATIELSAAKADVGDKITATGKVSGKGSAHKTVKLQYRNASGAWSSVKTLSTSSTGTYKVSFRVRTAGARALRLAVPAKGKVAKGYSSAAVFTGWRWLDLYDESYLSDGFVIRGWDRDVSGTVNGGTPPRETFVLHNQDASGGKHPFLAWRINQACDRLTALAGASDSDDDTKHVSVEGTTTERYEVVPGEMTSIDQSLVGRGGFVLRRDAGDGGGYLVVEIPRAHCSVNTLPVAYD